MSQGRSHLLFFNICAAISLVGVSVFAAVLALALQHTHPRCHYLLKTAGIGFLAGTVTYLLYEAAKVLEAPSHASGLPLALLLSAFAYFAALCLEHLLHTYTTPIHAHTPLKYYDEEGHGLLKEESQHMEMVALQEERYDELMMEQKVELDEFDAQLNDVFGEERYPGASLSDTFIVNHTLQHAYLSWVLVVGACVCGFLEGMQLGSHNQRQYLTLGAILLFKVGYSFSMGTILCEVTEAPLFMRFTLAYALCPVLGLGLGLGFACSSDSILIVGQVFASVAAGLVTFVCSRKLFRELEVKTDRGIKLALLGGGFVLCAGLMCAVAARLRS